MYCNGLAIGNKKGMIVVVVGVVVVLTVPQLLYYYYNSCWTIIITIGWSIRITCPFHCFLICFDTGTATMSSLLLLLIFYNLIYYYYYFKSTNHSDSTLSLSVIVDWDISLPFEPINCSINTKFHIANTDRSIPRRRHHHHYWLF